MSRLLNYVCRAKAISNTHSECVSVALVMQHANSMFRILLSPVACLDVANFSTLSHKRHEYRKKKVIFSKRGLIFSANIV